MNELPERIERWLPIVGRWTFQEQGIAIYEGPQEEPRLPYGICVSNVRFSEGEASATICLPAGDSDLGRDSSGRLLLGYQSPSMEYFIVGLGGYGYAYTLSRYDPSFGWRGLALTGSHLNLSGGGPVPSWR